MSVYFLNQFLSSSAKQSGLTEEAQPIQAGSRILCIFVHKVMRVYAYVLSNHSRLLYSVCVCVAERDPVSIADSS